MKSVIISISDVNSSSYSIDVEAMFYDSINQLFLGNIDLNFTLVGITDAASLKAAIQTNVISYAATQGWTVAISDIIWQTQPASPVSSSFSLSVVTGNGATGTQVSASQDSDIYLNATIVTAATLAAGAVGTLVLEVAPTNSATPSDWIEWGRIGNGQVFSLAIAIGCIQTIAGQLKAYVQAGYYVKLRSITTSGTPTYSVNSGRKVLK